MKNPLKLLTILMLNIFIFGAFTGIAGAQTVELAAKYVNATSITLEWKAENAVKYELYNDNEKIAETTENSFTQTALNPKTEYSYHVVAFFENGSQRSETIKVTTNALNTTINGIEYSASKRSRSAYTDVMTVKEALGKPLYLQHYSNGEWITKKTIKTKNTIAAQTVTVGFPNLWWTRDNTKWRIKLNNFTSRTITLTTIRFYQNPKKYLQLKNKISKHGLKYYVYPCQVNNASTRKNHVDAMIKAAKKYLGDPYVICRSRAPGKGVDCSGIVMQAAYAAGADLWPSNPYRHRFPKYEYESRNIAKMKKLKTVSYRKKKRGDLIFYSMGGRVVHVAIYIGHGKIIHSYFGGVKITKAANPKFGYISKVKRIFI